MLGFTPESFLVLTKPNKLMPEKKINKAYKTF